MYTNGAKVVALMKTGNYVIDERQTTELKQPELLVVSGRGDVDHFYCILVPSKARPGCPRCWNPLIRNQGNLHRNFLDVIRRGDDAAVVTVSLEFRKSKCVAADCGRVYYPEYSFASPYARTTRRLDDAIVRMVLRGGLSYAEIADELKGQLSRQVVGQIYHRRVKELNADFSEQTSWYRELLEEGPLLFYSSALSRRRRLP